jgi:hypothetical protein
MREAENGRRRREADTVPPTAEHSSTGSSFEVCFEQLRRTVRDACAGHSDWEAKIGSGLCAVLEFAAESPAAARELTDRGKHSSQRADEVITYFAQRLADVAPREQRQGVSNDQAVIEFIAILVRGALVAGSTEHLPALAPELLSLALLPYAGSTRTRYWVEAVASDGYTGT